MRQTRHALVISFAILVAVNTSILAKDWSMSGRTATRNPVSLEKRAPLWWHTPDWEDVGRLESRNIKWQARLGSHAKGDPIVANGLVWVGTNNHYPRDPKIQEKARVLQAVLERN